MPSRIEYSPREVEHMSDAEERKVYSRLRKLARRRALRLFNAGYGDFEVAKIFPKLSEIRPQDVRSYILDASLYLTDPRTLVRGMREYIHNMIKTLHRHGYTFVNKNNLKAFGEFMENVRAVSVDKTYYNPKVMDLFKEAQRLGISNNVLNNKFMDFINNEKELSQLVETMRSMNIAEGRTRVSSTSILNRMK